MREPATYEQIAEHKSLGRDVRVIKSGWVLTKRSPSVVKCRFVATEVNYGQDRERNVYASTQTTMSHRLLMARSLERQWPLLFGDISTAFVHGRLPEDS